MIKLLHESFKNLPKWITDNLNSYELRQLDKKGIDLYNCTYEEADDLKIRDDRWKDDNLFPVFLIKDINYRGDETQKLYIYGITDPYISSDQEQASKHSRKWLLNNSIHKGFINISNNQKASKDRYIDPRYSKDRHSRHQQYAGQKLYKGNYYTNSGRDKSGYEIPDPSKKLARLYELDLDNYADVIERYYNKINSCKNKLFNIDIKSVANDSTYGRALRVLSDTVDTYNKLDEEIAGIIRMFNKYPEEQRTPELFRRLYQDWGYNIRYINSNITDLQKLIKALEA